MKKITLIAAAVMMAWTLMLSGNSAFAQSRSTSPGEGAPKILIAYYSHTGNTKLIADHIHSLVGGDLFEIKPLVPYPSDHKTLVDQAEVELENNHRPALAATVQDMGSYDVVFIGYPNWWATMAMPLFTFLETHDLSGKTVIPFSTHGGSRFGRSLDDLKKLAPNSTIREGLAISRTRLDGSKSEVQKWVTSLGLAK